MSKSISGGRRVATALLIVAGLGGSTGCEFITAVDRSTIPEASGGPGAGGAGGAGGQGGQGGVGPGGGEGGSGAGPMGCVTAEDCPGEDTECQTRTCEGGACGVDYAPQNKPVAAQVASDCKRDVCDGQGNVITVDDDTDVLVDGDACSSDLCAGGVPSNPPAPAATPCDTGGGHFCDGSGACVECLTGGDCQSGVCEQDVCVAPTCGDGVVNGGESDVDCGGPDCMKCSDLAHCWVGSDCENDICQNNACKPPTCLDFTQNGQETDVDCGGPACNKCGTGKGCSQNSDCYSDICSGTVCLPSCTDNVKNGQETGIDCGGGVCPACPNGQLCNQASDCQSGVCTGGVCTPTLGGDGQTHPSEACGPYAPDGRNPWLLRTARSQGPGTNLGPRR